MHSTTTPAPRARPRLLAAPAFVFAVLYAGHASAYLDPGTGSILLQGLIAGIAATMTFASIYWQKTKGLLRWLLRRPSREADGDDAPPR